MIGAWPQIIPLGKIMPLLIPKIIQFEGLQKKQSAKTKIYQFPSAAPSALFLKIRSYVI